MDIHDIIEEEPLDDTIDDETVEDSIISKALGFSSFGSSDTRPSKKRRVDTVVGRAPPVTGANASMLPPKPASLPQRPAQGPSQPEQTHSENGHEGSGQGHGSGKAWYVDYTDKRFSQNPWERLETKLGLTTNGRWVPRTNAAMTG